MNHMQRICKIISPRVKFYIVKVLFEQFIQANDKVLSDPTSKRLGHYCIFRIINAKLSD